MTAAANGGSMDWDALLQQSEELAAGVRWRGGGAGARWSRGGGGAASPGRRAAGGPAPMARASPAPRRAHAPIPSSPQDAHGFPRVERDLAQVERYASALRARVARADAGADAAAASRLLAAEGVHTRK